MKALGLSIFLALSIITANAQTTNYTKNALNVDVIVSNPCDGSTTNGSITFKVNASNGPAILTIVSGPNETVFPNQTIAVGGTYSYVPAGPDQAGSYDFIIHDNTNNINTFPAGAPDPFTMTDLSTIVINEVTKTNNTDCTTPNGKVVASITGGSMALTGGGSYTYTWSTNNGLAGLPLTGTFDGTTNLDLASLLSRTGLPGGTYTLLIVDNYSSCSQTHPFTITDPSPINTYTVSTTTPSICLGASGSISLSNTEGTFVSYQVYKNGVIDNNVAPQFGHADNSGLTFAIPASDLTPTATYNFTIQATNGSCTPAFMTTSANIVVNSLPTTSAITGNASVCSNTTGVAYSVTSTPGSTYAWTITGGNQASGGTSSSITVDWGAAGAGNVQVIETNAASCPGTAVNLPVTIKATPSTSSITGNANVCVSTNGVSYSVTNTAGSTYAWTITGGTQASGTTTHAITVNWGSTAGPGDVKVIETNSVGCPGTAVDLPVTINAKPATSAITGSASVCANATGVTYSVTNTAGSTYAWTITGGSQTGGGTSNIITVDWGAGPSGNVKVVETNSAGCVGAAKNKAITINAAPTTSAISGNVAVCANTNGVSYSVTNTSGSTYAWTITGGTQASGTNTSSITVNWGAAGSGNVKVVETNSAGCPGSAVNLPVTITSPSTSAITGNASVCENMNAVGYSVTNTLGSTYTWTITGGTQVSGANTSSITVNWGPAGAGNVKVVETSSGGCVGAAVNLPVTINSAPATSAITGATPICENTTTNYSVTNTAGSTYAWTITGGAQTGGGTNHNISVTWGSAGPGNVEVVETNAAGCAGTAVDLSVSITAAPTTSLAGTDQTICLATSATLAANTPLVGTGAWSVTSGPSTLATQFSSITDPSATFTPAGGAGNYVLTWTISNAPCTASTSNVTITVSSPLTPTVSISPTPGSSVCAGTNVTFTATPVNGGIPSYQWKKNGTNVGLNSDTYSDNALVNGDQISVVMTSSLSCVTSSTATGNTVTMTVNPTPTTSAIVGTTTVCENTNGVAYSVTNTAGSSYAWTITGGTQATGTNTSSITVNWGAAGAGNIQVVETNASSCVGSPVSLPVTINGAPTIASAGSDQTICASASATLAANSPAIGTGTWSVTSGPSTSASQFSSVTNPTATFTPAGGAGAYVLTWTISNAPCAPSSSNVTINVDAAPTSSNAGPDQGVCGTSTSLSGNNPIVGTGTWSIISGAGGSIGSVNNPTSNFTGTAGTSYTLRWTISNGTCTASTDDVNIIFSTPPTTAAAGPDQDLCGNSTSLAANIPASGSGTWSIISGVGGFITSVSNPTSTFNGFAGQSYTLRWTITNGACSPSTDDVNIVLDQAPTTAAAGPDQSVCGTSTALAANAPLVGAGSWSIISGSGGSITDPLSPTSTFTGTAGTTYVLRWTVGNGSCAPSTDDVSITFNVAPTTASAGADQDLCNVTTTNLAGNIPTFGVGQWSVVSGTATITTPSSPTSGITGLVPGTVTLRWTISSGSCPASTDDVDINVAAPPTIAAAGSDQTVCGPAALAANTPISGTGAWSVVTGAGGSFSDATNSSSTFTGVGGTTYTLRWTITSGTCAPSTDDVDITFDINSPTPANAGADQNNCGTTVTLAANTPAVGTGGWSIVSGTGGSFVDATNPTTDFSGIQGNVYTLRWTITSGACTPSTDDVVITFDQIPTTSNAGLDQTLCGTSTTLTGNTPSIGTGMWSIVSGVGGSFVDATDGGTVFNGTQGTVYTLRWTISNGSCTASTDDVSITFEQAPTTSDAGADQSACGASITLAGNIPGSGNGLWSVVSGAGGSFVDATNPVTMFNGTQGTIYVLRWTISNGTCTPSTDDVSITFDQTPTTADAGLDQTPCGPTTLAANSPTIGTGAWSIVSGVGGSFSDTTSPTSNFSGTAGTTYVLRWTISNGSCPPSTDDVQIQFDANTPTTANAGSDQDICGSSTALAANIPVVGTGAWSIVSGSGGSFVDATNPTTTFSGTAGTTYTLRWTISSSGGCTPSSDDVQIIFDQTPSTAFAGTDQSGCNTNVTLAANTPSVGTGTWTIVSGAGGSITNPSSPNSGFTGAYGNTYTLRWTISNACATSSDDVVININPAGSCVVTGNCATVVIVPKTTPATCTNYDGQIIFSIKPFVPAVNNIGVNISFTGTAFDGSTYSDSHRNDSTFVGVPSGTFNYTIVYGDPSCTITGQVTVDHSGSIGTPVASNPIDAACYGTASGAVTLDVPGETGNQLEWSLDGVQWHSFTAGNQITGIPAGPAPTFQRVLSVRRNASDLCSSPVTVTINNASTAIVVTSALPTDASCANNDGSWSVTSISGGTGPYPIYKFDGIITTNLSFTNLTGGNHTFEVQDNNGCIKDTVITVNFPGFVNFTTQSVAPDCSGSGQNGSIVATIIPSGSFDIGVTSDPNNDPSVFQSVVSTGNTQVTFPGLSQGKYYVVAKPNGALCQTRDTATVSGGPFAVDFSYKSNNFVCFENKGIVDVYGIKGSLTVAYNYEIINAGNVIQSGTITQLQALDTVKLVGLDKGSYQIHLFQDQSASTGCVNPIASSFKDFIVDGPSAVLDTLYVVRKFSQTNLPTGSMLIGISESQEPSYQIMLHLLDPKRAGQKNNNLFDSTFVTATRNNTDNNIEFNATGLYAGDYRLYIRDTLGCTKTYDLYLDYNRDLFIPNIFTPNNDGRNDNFEILNLPDNSSIVITNRWGKEVHKASGLKVGVDNITAVVWNGGSESDGIYFYTLNAGGKTYTGWVELLHPTD